MTLHEPASLDRESSTTGADSGLMSTYLAYCEREASALLGIMPREAVRGLYRAAREWAVETGVYQRKEPMGSLVQFCRRLLPLPPFAVWVEDYQTHRLAYMESLAAAPFGSVDDEPVSVRLRTVVHEGEQWFATLEVSHDGRGWRGHIRFHREGRSGTHRTGEIFVEEDLRKIRERFDDFTDQTVAAFLRSALP